MQQYEYPKLKNKEFDALQALDYSYHSENLDTFAEQCQKYMGALLSAVKRIAARSDAEQANPTSHPMSEEEVAAYLREPLGPWSSPSTTSDRIKINAEPTWEEESEAILADAKVRAQFAPLQAVFDGFESIMRYKNRQYGNTGLEPVGVFSKGDTLEKLLSRADDKVSRIKNSPVLRKNDVVDLMGYLVLVCAHQGWNDFTDQQD